MSKFTDEAKNEWHLSVTVGTLRRVRERTKVDLMEIADPKASLVARLSSSPELLVDVIFAVIKPQADELGVSATEFDELVAGDSVAAATDALIEAVVDFFPHARGRGNLRAIYQKSRAAVDALADLGAEAIESGEIDRAIDEALSDVRQAISGASSTDAPASSESTPAA